MSLQLTWCFKNNAMQQQLIKVMSSHDRWVDFLEPHYSWLQSNGHPTNHTMDQNVAGDKSVSVVLLVHGCRTGW